MGYFGNHSFHSDYTLDVLEDFTDDVDNITQKQATAALKKAWEENPTDQSWTPDDEKDLIKLGSVCFILFSGLRVSIDKLKETLALANKYSTTYRLRQYGSPTKRKKYLEREINEIKRALKRNGRGRKIDRNATFCSKCGSFPDN